MLLAIILNAVLWSAVLVVNLTPLIWAIVSSKREEPETQSRHRPEVSARRVRRIQRAYHPRLAQPTR